MESPVAMSPLGVQPLHHDPEGGRLTEWSAGARAAARSLSHFQQRATATHVDTRRSDRQDGRPVPPPSIALELATTVGPAASPDLADQPLCDTSVYKLFR